MTTSAHHIRILVVEDEYLIALMIEDTIRGLGFEVAGPVGDLPGAVRLAESEPLSAAILDVHLQRGERVYPVVEILQRRGVPLMLTTAYREIEIERAYAGQILLRKPFDQAQLEQCVVRLLEPARSRRT